MYTFFNLFRRATGEERTWQRGQLNHLPQKDQQTDMAGVQALLTKHLEDTPEGERFLYYKICSYKTCTDTI